MRYSDVEIVTLFLYFYIKVSQTYSKRKVDEIISVHHEIMTV